MAEVEADQLKRAVEAQHGCRATLAQSVPVRDTFGGKRIHNALGLKTMRGEMLAVFADVLRLIVGLCRLPVVSSA